MAPSGGSGGGFPSPSEGWLVVELRRGRGRPERTLKTISGERSGGLDPDHQATGSILSEAVLDGGLGVPCTGHPRYAGSTTRPRLVNSRIAPGKQC